jgi:hypothetical protein
MAESNGTRMKRIRRIFTDLSLDLSVLVRQIRLIRVPLTRAPEIPLLNLGLPEEFGMYWFSRIPPWLILSPTHFVSIYWLKLRTNPVCIPINSCGSIRRCSPVPAWFLDRSIEQKRMRWGGVRDLGSLRIHVELALQGSLIPLNYWKKWANLLTSSRFHLNSQRARIWSRGGTIADTS